MLSSNGMQVTIEYFLNLIKSQNPEISPSIFMMDRDHAQVNAIHAAFPQCQRVFYCWWHVLQAIHTHFNTKEFPKLWSLIQDWVRLIDDDKFNIYWKQIQGDPDVPKSVAEYIAREWLPHKEMWSAASCQNCTIFEEGDTNMLLEAYVMSSHISNLIYLFIMFFISYHHVLKSIWLEGKRNRRVDHLIHTLVIQYLPHLEIRHKRQERGMEGADLAEMRRRQILTHAPETPLENIRKNDDLHFDVQSSNSNKIYKVNLGTTSCACSDFPHICMCKHIVAFVHLFFGADLRPQALVFFGA